MKSDVLAIDLVVARIVVAPTLNSSIALQTLFLLFSSTTMLSVMPSGWRAPPGCPEHIRFVLEKTVNDFPPEWLEEPETGEVYSSEEEANDRLVAYSLSQGFDIVVTHSTTKPQPCTTYSCIHHGKETRNYRKLPDIVTLDPETGKVAVDSARKRNLTVVRQTDCPWSVRVSYKLVGKRRSGQRAWVLTVKDDSHGDTHPLAQNPLIYQRHRERLQEYQQLKAQARAHRVSIVPYTLSRRVLDAVDGSGLSLTRREYYNLKKYEAFNPKDDKSIEGLLYATKPISSIDAVLRMKSMIPQMKLLRGS